ncbi:MAG: hypothetical protein AB8E82_01395 [Aureispira sp.]
MELIVVQYFYDLTTLALAERYLEVAGVKTITRDALMTQVTGIEARAIGGAKLLVRKNDYVKASRLLQEGGFMNKNVNTTPFWLADVLDQVACLLPGVGRLSKELRLVIIVFLLFSLCLSIVYAILLY